MNVRPITLGSPEDKLAKAIAVDLAIYGLDGGLCLPAAIHILTTIVENIDNPLAGIESLKESRRRSDTWWVKQHPKTKTAREAKRRLDTKENIYDRL
jgi:hypothetical protein